MGDENTANSKRLFSLDALRGFDMILLTVVAPLVNAAQRGWKCFPDSYFRFAMFKKEYDDMGLMKTIIQEEWLIFMVDNERLDF